ncbi:hypothetical protein ACE3MZ_21215 [Paenibacillus sp. WLX1005]|uniref:hypothetical protein n=1 Tax=Paenibacillus sp. WLX1005 TaxID=3243766 RepID=UPI0039843307
MSLIIQASCPRFIKATELTATTLSEAVEHSFPLVNESALLIWNYVPIILNYKYDISVMLDDILDMLASLRGIEYGKKEIHWPSNDFSSIWILSWGMDTVTIDAKWSAVLGNTEQLLTSSGEVEMEKQMFLAEWKSILRNIILALDYSGYSQNTTINTKKLLFEYEAIKYEGELYR